MNKKCINITAYSQHILHEDTLYNINRQKYKTVCAELPFIKDIFDRLAMILYGICYFVKLPFCLFVYDNCCLYMCLIHFLFVCNL